MRTVGAAPNCLSQSAVAARAASSAINAGRTAVLSKPTTSSGAPACAATQPLGRVFVSGTRPLRALGYRPGARLPQR